MDGCFWLDVQPTQTYQEIPVPLIKLKEPGLQVRLFQFFFLLGRRREITYEGNFITCLQNMLDASPTSAKRLGNGFYEIF